VQDDEHFLTVCRYVERNPLRANLVERAEDWPWSSLSRWRERTAEAKRLLSAWPLARRPGWVEHVNAPQSEAELAALRRSLQRGSPFGDERWTDRMARRLDLESTLRPRGRPKKAGKGS
jgi:putative transposase